jgi:hypothetical protein
LNWRTLRNGRDSALVLAIDFGPGRATAGFADLAAGLETGHTILEPVFGSPGELFQTTPDEYVQRWITDLGGYGEVEAVFGFCAGASLACATADAIGGEGSKPLLVLFDPLMVNAHVLYQSLVSAVGSFDEVIMPAERAQVLDDALVAAPGADAAPVVSAIVAAYQTVVTTAAHRLGLDEDLVEQIVHRFQSYLAYLSLAGRVPPEVLLDRPAERRPVVLVSAEHVLPTGLTADLTLDTPAADLLADVRLTHATARLLADPRGDRLSTVR